MNEALDRRLRELAGSDGIWFQPNPGNAGDSMLTVAARQKFVRLGIQYREIGHGFDATDKVVVIGGGGNLVPHYGDLVHFLQRHHSKARRLVLLPQTIDGNEELLASLGSNATIFCREKVSFAHCLRQTREAEVLLGHDLAIDLDLAPLTPFASPLDLAAHLLGSVFVPGIGLADRRSRIRRLGGILGPWRQRSGSNGKVLHAMRGDVEGDIGRRPPPDNIDISAFLTLEHGTGRNAEFATRLLLGWLSNYKSVKTDRLHVCIACGLLGLDVEFFPNNYFKCAAVWEHSLRDRFPNIRWAGIVHTSVGKN